jgi:hypothetical protein
MSVSVWFKTTTAVAANMVSKFTSAGGTGWTFNVTNGGGGYITFYTNESGSSWHSRGGAFPSFADGNWHHAVATLSGGANGTIKIYGDGVDITATCPEACDDSGTPPSTYTTTHDIWIGLLDNGTPWDGSLDDVRIYNRVLSASEVQQLYKLGSVTIH